MSEKVNPIPEGFVGVCPYLTVKGAKAAIEFYQKALGAELSYTMPMPGTDMLLHAEIKLAGNTIMLSEENPEWGSKGPEMIGDTPVTLHLYVEDVDAALARAVEAGAEVTMPAEDMFWGDRYARFTDPFGHKWGLATHISDPTPEEMEKAIAEFANSQPG